MRKFRQPYLQRERFVGVELDEEHWLGVEARHGRRLVVEAAILQRPDQIAGGQIQQKTYCLTFLFLKIQRVALGCLKGFKLSIKAFLAVVWPGGPIYSCSAARRDGNYKRSF